jgi:dolichyl-phosphate beta-glucosyltransferase
LLGRGFNALVRTLVLPGLDDTQCGFKLFTARAVDMIFPATTIPGWAFDVEILYIARLRGLRICQVPIEWHYRELSRVSAVRDSLRMMRDIVRIKVHGMRGTYTRR